MHAETKASLAAKLASLSTAAASPASARAALDDLHREHGDLPKQLERKFARLPTPQQRVLLELVQAAGAREYVPLLQSVSRQPEVPLAIRNQAAAVAEPLGGEVDSPYGEALRRAADTLAQLQEAGDTALTAEGELAPRWQQAVLNLPIALACDLARELASAHPAVALAVLRSLRPIIDARDRYAFVETAGHIALPESAALLQDLLAEAAAKPLQKTIRRALHRLRGPGRQSA
ncbi:MAG: hypothetical protein KatS3mg131_1702 [Candidatus Tectimicrobiota bacterium]|nr:MAG: hypothetical protein KatS3mg131_1702 [Candidatus Tectomicrobia bacterium]